MAHIGGFSHKNTFPSFCFWSLKSGKICASNRIRIARIGSPQGCIDNSYAEPSFRDSPLQIHLQPDIVNSDVDPEKNRVEGRLDLQVSCGYGVEVYFAIEAKRLRVSLPSGLFSGSREYVKNGMMRFVTGQYAPFMQAGAMLGYIYDGNIKNAHSDIDRQILKHERELKLKEPKKLTPSILLSHQYIDETKHDLENRPFTVYHLFLAV